MDTNHEEIYIIEEFNQVPSDDVEIIKNLFGTSFPLRYGDYFYESLKKGRYAGRPLLTCVARKQGKIIGAACATKEDDESESQVVASGNRTYLMTLAVEETERRKGIASGLISRVTDWASRDQTCTALYLHVIAYNTSAMEFYTRLGFTKFGRVADFYPIEGQTHDAFVYVIYMNGGKAPPPEPPSFIDKIWDWITDALTSVASFAFGKSATDEDEEYVEEESKVENMV